MITDRAARKWLLDNTKILAIIDLPEETFQPYTNTKTSVVFAERPDRKFNQNYSVFMAISNKIGHDKRGNSTYKWDNDGKPIENTEGNMILDIDTGDIVKDYKAYIEGKNTFSNKSFVVSLEEMVEADRIDASYFNPAARMARKKIISSVPLAWKLSTVGDVTRDVFYPPRFKRIYVEKQYGVPFLSGANITRHTKVGIKYLSKKNKKTG